MINGNRHGGLARSIADKIKSQRLEALSPDHPLRNQSAPSIISLPPITSPSQQREQELQGGTIIVGRHTFKEYMRGLRLGWTEGLDDIDREEALARQLASDGMFDEPDMLVTLESEGSDGTQPSANSSSTARGSKSPLFSHLIAPPMKASPLRSPEPHQRQSTETLPVPQEILPQPPLLLLPFKNLLGFWYIPHMMVDFFNERKRAREGAEAAYTLIEGQTRDFVPPDQQTEINHLLDPSELEGLETPTDPLPTVGPQGGDLDFDIEQERYIRKSYNKVPKEIAEARKKYYEALPGRLAAARSLARNEREPTKDEREHPPPTEVELISERFKKELKWREELDAWRLLRPGSGVDWDSRLASALRVYKSPSI
jgi:import inner membrane translocase subunit TIM54